MKVLPFRSALESAWPSAVTCGVAFVPIASELYSKLTSRSMLGRFWAIEAICSCVRQRELRGYSSVADCF